MNSPWLVIVRYGEVSIKGKVGRARMERQLVRNIVDALEEHNISAKPRLSEGRMWICCFKSEEEALNAANVLSHVMGIVSLSPAVELSFGSLDDLKDEAVKFFGDKLRGKTFAVRARRVGTHSFTSKDVEKIVGAALLPYGSKVDLSNPEYIAYIELRKDKAYFYDKIVKGPGGLPLGSEGKVLSLFSGGIDSPVATWYALKRGCAADLLLFNIGGEKQVWSVAMVAKVLADRWFYGYKPKMYVVDVRPLIARIAVSTPENYVVIILRRYMNRIAERLAQRIGALALVTGESLGQVASQTLNNIYVIEEAVKIPILRPLIGLDKEEITTLARKIGTYDYSIRVEEYCSLGTRVTTPAARLDKVREYESKASVSDGEIDKMLDEAVVVDLKSISIDHIKSKLGSLGLGNRYGCKA